MSWLDDLLYGYRTIRDALDADSPARAILKIVGATITDNPTTGETIVTIASGTPLASVVGSDWIAVDATDPQNPIISLDAGTSDAGDGALRTITGQLPEPGSGGDGGNVEISGAAGDGAGADGGVALQVGGTTVFRVGEEAGFGGAPVAYVGAEGGPAGLLIPGECTQCEVMYLDRPDAGDARNITFSGQNATDGNGGNMLFTSGAKAGGGTLDGYIAFGVAGDALLKLAEGVAIVGDVNNSTTPSVNLAGPEASSATGGGATALPALPQDYLEIKVNGVTRLIPYYNP